MNGIPDSGTDWGGQAFLIKMACPTPFGSEGAIATGGLAARGVNGCTRGSKKGGLHTDGKWQEAGT